MKARLTGWIMGIAACALPWAASADTVSLPLTAEQTEQCVTLLSGFPDETTEARYLFFRLSQELAKDITPELSSVMADYMASKQLIMEARSSQLMVLRLFKGDEAADKLGTLMGVVSHLLAFETLDV